MEEITYRQAAELLNCEYITIRQAVMQKRLTKCVGKTTLLKEQVQLFKGKRGITIHALNLEEKQLWEEYKKIAEDPELLEKSKHISMSSREVLTQAIENKIKELKNINSEKEVELVLLVSNREKIIEILQGFNINPTTPLVQVI